jgi:hypothetical protein
MSWNVRTLLILSLGIVAAMAGTGVAEALETRDLKLDGEIDTWFSFFRSEGPSGQNDRESVVSAHFRPKVALAEGASANFDFLVRADAGNSTRDVIRPDEAYVSLELDESWKLRAGKIIYSWGSAFLYNPTDFINPMDFYDFTHVDKLGVIAMDATWTASPRLNLRFGVLPVFQPSLVADSTSRWTDFTQLLQTAVLPRLNLPVGIPTGSQLSFNLANPPTTVAPQAFVRAELNEPGFDLSLLYAYHVNPVPSDLLFTSNASFDVITNRPVISVQGIPYYSQEHLFGADFSVPIAGGVAFVDATLGVSSGQSSGVDPDLLLSELSNLGITGLSRDQVANPPESPTLIVAAGARRDWRRWHGELEYTRVGYLGPDRPGALFSALGSQLGASSPISPSTVYDFVSGALLGGATWEATPKTTLRAGGLYNLSSEGFLAYLAAAYTFAGAVRASASYTYLDGTSGSLFSYYSGNTKLELALNAVF